MQLEVASNPETLGQPEVVITITSSRSELRPLAPHPARFQADAASLLRLVEWNGDALGSPQD